MPHQQFLDNWKNFSNLVNELSQNTDEHMAVLINRYVEQNFTILNEIFATSIVHLNKLKAAKSPNEIICNQAQFTNEVGKKLSLSAQRFLNASLGNISDYNEWLKTHCDLATD